MPGLSDGLLADQAVLFGGADSLGPMRNNSTLVCCQRPLGLVVDADLTIPQYFWSDTMSGTEPPARAVAAASHDSARDHVALF